MKDHDKYNKAIQFCLKEMFLRVGKKYVKEDLTNNPNWYMLHAWTMREERMFERWMISFLVKKLKCSKRTAKEYTSYFLLGYGWKIENTFPIKVMNMNDQKYRLTVAIPFDAFDTIDARKKAKDLLVAFGIKDDDKNAEIKLQRIFTNKAPEKVEI